MRPIDADSLVNLIKIRDSWHTGYSIEEVISDIEQSPTINEFGEPQKKTGEWIAVEKPRFGNPYRHYKCSHCGNLYHTKYDTVTVAARRTLIRKDNIMSIKYHKFVIKIQHDFIMYKDYQEIRRAEMPYEFVITATEDACDIKGVIEAIVKNLYEHYGLKGSFEIE